MGGGKVVVCSRAHNFISRGSYMRSRLRVSICGAPAYECTCAILVATLVVVLLLFVLRIAAPARSTMDYVCECGCCCRLFICVCGIVSTKGLACAQHSAGLVCTTRAD